MLFFFIIPLGTIIVVYALMAELALRVLGALLAVGVAILAASLAFGLATEAWTKHPVMTAAVALVACFVGVRMVVIYSDRLAAERKQALRQRRHPYPC